MNPDGDIRQLPEGEKPLPEEIELSEKEAAILLKLRKEERHPTLKQMRAEEKRERRRQRNLRVPKQPKSILPKSLR